MAETYKCTKITNTGESLFVTNAYRIRCDYVDPTTTPPTPGSVSVDVDKADAEVVADLQAAIDTQLELLGTNTMNWSL
jgi:hypothetical protein